MSLIPIPYEETPTNSSRKKGKKSFRPKMKDAQLSRDEKLLKSICVKLVDFVNRGGKFTINQIDELIMGLQRSILSLQRKKKELLEHGDSREKHSWLPFKNRRSEQ